MGGVLVAGETEHVFRLKGEDCGGGLRRSWEESDNSPGPGAEAGARKGEWGYPSWQGGRVRTWVGSSLAGKEGKDVSGVRDHRAISEGGEVRGGPLPSVSSCPRAWAAWTWAASGHGNGWGASP